MDLTEEVGMRREAALLLLAYGHADTPGAPSLDTLRVAARLWQDRDTVPGTDTAWGLRLADAVRGLDDASPGAPARRIATEEELAAASAVVGFLIRVPYAIESRVVRTAHRTSSNGWRGENRTSIQNPHLESLLRERPADCDRIISYVAERGMHPKRKRDVDELRAWLDSDSSAALGDGWL